MEAVRITAVVPGPIAMPRGAIAVDALLMATRARVDGLPPVEIGGFQKIEIPIVVEPSRRFHLASFSLGGVEAHDRHWINRRFPVEQAQTIGSRKIKRLQISAGPAKSYRLPFEVGYLVGSKLEWYVLGDAEKIQALLDHVSFIGKKRSVGKGEVERWTVERSETWEGFPVVKDGRALRPLPVDWPGLVDPQLDYRTVGCVGAPYWDHAREELCAVP